MKECSGSRSGSMLGRDVDVEVVEVVIKKGGSGRGSKAIFETGV
jgi:hypothetical protein